MDRKVHYALHLTVALAAVGLLALLLMLAAVAQPAVRADGDTIKVPDDYATIQAAIDAAEEGDTILVASGTYTENLSITEGITLSGGWNITFTVQSPGQTTIDGNGQGRVISITCATSDTVVTVDGFTIQDGDATGFGMPVIPEVPESGGEPYHSAPPPPPWVPVMPATGSGSYRSLDGTQDRPEGPAPMEPRSPSEQADLLGAHLADLAARDLYPGGERAFQAMVARLEWLTALAEEARARPGSRPAPAKDQPQGEVGMGGGVYSWNASLHLLNCGIDGNVASQTGDGYGGGVYAGRAAPSGVLIANNEIGFNEASSSGHGLGGGLYLFETPGATVEGNQILGNVASSDGTGWGGGLCAYGAPSATIEDNEVSFNLATAQGTGQGGGLYLTDASGATIGDNTVNYNLASNDGEGWGGGLYLFRSTGAILEDNTFFENLASNAGLFVDGLGGGLVVDLSPEAVVRRNHLERNVASAAWQGMTGLGGGLWVRDADGVEVSDNEFRENLAGLYGIGMGGGLTLFRTENARVADNKLTGNMASFAGHAQILGGGINLDRTNNALVSGNELEENTACVLGGDFVLDYCLGGGLHGMYATEGFEVSGNTFTANTASQASTTGVAYGGGGYIEISEYTQVTGNTFSGNVASLAVGGPQNTRVGGGGGLYTYFTLGSQVQGNRFEDNRGSIACHGFAGGLVTDGLFFSSKDSTVDANLFLHNEGSADPDLAFIPSTYVDIETVGLTFSNNVVVGNVAARLGTAGLLGTVRGQMVNNTLAYNGGSSVLVDSVYSPVTLTNNIVVSHTVGISVTEGATATVRYTLWHGNDTDIAGAGTISHTHPVSGTPGFVDPANHDCHLTLGSAAINAGDPVGVPPAPDHDADGVARPQGPSVDLGAYEWQGYWRYLPLVAKDSR